MPDTLQTEGEFNGDIVMKIDGMEAQFDATPSVDWVRRLKMCLCMRHLCCVYWYSDRWNSKWLVANTCYDRLGIKLASYVHTVIETKPMALEFEIVSYEILWHCPCWAIPVTELSEWPPDVFYLGCCWLSLVIGDCAPGRCCIPEESGWGMAVVEERVISVA